MNREPDTWVHCGLITPAQLVERYTFGLPLFMRMSDKYGRTKKKSAEGRRILTHDSHQGLRRSADSCLSRSHSDGRLWVRQAMCKRNRKRKASEQVSQGDT